jgi:thioredoxin 1
MAAVVELKDADFDAAVASGVTLVDFWAPWCGPCRMQGPIVEKLAEEMGDQAKICKMNVDEEQETAAKFMVQSIPTLLLLKNGEVVQQFVGVTRAVELKAVILDALA